MTDDSGLLNSHQRKKLARKQRRQSERQAARTLDTVTTGAIERTLELARSVAGGLTAAAVIDIDVASLSEARFVLKRVNAVLQTEELLDAVRVWVWDAAAHRSAPRSARGRELGFELRIEAVPR